MFKGGDFFEFVFGRGYRYFFVLIGMVGLRVFEVSNCLGSW